MKKEPRMIRRLRRELARAEKILAGQPVTLLDPDELASLDACELGRRYQTALRASQKEPGKRFGGSGISGR